MILKSTLFFVGFFFIHIGYANTLHTETLPNGSKITFYAIDEKPFSKKQLKVIENNINIRIKKMSKLFPKQSPKKNLSALHQFKKYLHNISNADDKKYKLTNTPLNNRILLLSHLLESLPKQKTFKPKHCQNYIHRLTTKAHVSLHSNDLTQWLSQILDLTDKLCPKSSPLKAKSSYETI